MDYIARIMFFTFGVAGALNLFFPPAENLQESILRYIVLYVCIFITGIALFSSKEKS